MPPCIRIQDHISSLADLDDTAFTAYVQRLKRRLSRSNTEAVLTRRIIDWATSGLQLAADRDPLLRRLLTLDYPGAAHSLLHHLTTALPPVRGRITCHLVPAADARGSGNCFGADRILVTLPASGDTIPWMSFVIAHEYSHTHRGYGPHRPDTVREHLIFEGLAMVLAESLAPKPQPDPWAGISPQQEEDFWERTDLDARGLEGYIAYLNSDTAYETAARIIRSYLQQHHISIAEAHSRTDADLYWNSGYPFIR